MAKYRLKKLNEYKDCELDTYYGEKYPIKWVPQMKSLYGKKLSNEEYKMLKIYGRCYVYNENGEWIIYKNNITMDSVDIKKEFKL